MTDFKDKTQGNIFYVLWTELLFLNMCEENSAFKQLLYSITGL